VERFREGQLFVENSLWAIMGQAAFSVRSTALAIQLTRSPKSHPTEERIIPAMIRCWKDEAASRGGISATRYLITRCWEFLRESAPSRLHQRYGDAEYDWEHRVNTTSGAVEWRERLLGVLHSPYQPTDPVLFREMLDDLQRRENLNFAGFDFLDLGSGKGRTLLMASDYPFRRIVGVEILPALARIAQENIRSYKAESRKCFAIECICADAIEFALPGGPLVIFLFNPFSEAGLRKFVSSLSLSVTETSRRVYVLYHNPLLEQELASKGLRKIGGTHQYAMFAAGADLPANGD